MKTNHKLIVLLVTLFSPFNNVLAQESYSNSLELFSQLTISDNEDKFVLCNEAIKRDPTISKEVRTELRIKFLSLAQRYLKNRSIPAGESVMHPPRPDGGIPGSDPSYIKDPILRAQYIQAIADNLAFDDARYKYRWRFQIVSE